MSIAKQIISAAAAASIATGASAGEQKPLPPFVKPAPQEAVLFDASFNQALKAFVTTLAAKQKPTDRMSQEVVSTAYNSIRKQQNKAPSKDQQVMLFDYTISSAVIIDTEQKTIAVFHATEDAMSGKITITDKTPVLAYSPDTAVKEEAITTQAIALLDKNNEFMAKRSVPNLGTALQPGSTGKLTPIDQKQR